MVFKMRSEPITPVYDENNFAIANRPRNQNHQLRTRFLPEQEPPSEEDVMGGSLDPMDERMYVTRDHTQSQGRGYRMNYH